MESSNHTDHLAKKRPLTILSKANYEQWFYLAELYFESKDQEFVLTTNSIEYASYAMAQPAGATGPATIMQDEDKRKKHKKADAEARYIIMICVDEFDQEAIRTIKDAKSTWTYLQKKYTDTRASVSSRYLVELTTFKMAEGVLIEEAWIQIKRIRSKVVAAKKEMADSFDEAELFQILLRALPKEYEALRDSMTAYQGPVDEKLRMLQDKEDRMISEGSALVAYRKGGAQGQRNQQIKLACYLCEDDHVILECPHLAGAKNWTKTAIRESRKKSRPISRRIEPTSSARKHTKAKPHAYAADEVEETNSSEYESASGDEEVGEEVAAFTKDYQSRTKLPNPSWIADTGASSHMTDQPKLFRGPLVSIKQRTIRVGGGMLYADHMGTAIVSVKGGKELRLANTLLVPSLGVNLVSGRKMVAAIGSEGILDKNQLTFWDRNKIIIASAKWSHGIYLISEIGNGKQEAAYSTFEDSPFEYETACPATSEMVLDPSIVQSEELIQSSDDQQPDNDVTDNDQKSYDLWHRRFAHFGSAKLKCLHKVTTMKTPIRVPAIKNLCRCCELTKKRNRISKHLSPWKEERLELVQIDISGPFPESLNGNKWFLEIIDNATRKVWTIPMKTKNQAIPELEKWAAQAELQTGCKLRGIRADNAPELVQIIDQFARSRGIAPEYTITYKSSQNGGVERSIQTANEATRVMLKDSEMPIEFWDEAAEAGAYLRNRLPVGLQNEKPSPEEAWSGEKPSVDHIKVWGCVCYGFVDRKSHPQGTRRDKLMDNGREAVFMGYVDQTTKQYKIYAPDLGYVTRSSVVRFDENKPGGSIALNMRKDPSVPRKDPTPIGRLQGTPNVLALRKPVGRPKRIVEAPTTRLGVPSKFSPLEIKGDQDDSLTPESPQEPEVVTPPLKRGRGRPRKAPIPQIKVVKRPVGRPTNRVRSPPPDQQVTERNRQPSIEELPDEDDRMDVQPTTRNDVLPVDSNGMLIHHIPEPVTGKRSREEDDSEDNDRERQKVKALVAHFMGEYGQQTGYAGTIDDTLSVSQQGSIPLPLTYRQAINDPVHGAKWKEATQREVRELTANGTFEETDSPRHGQGNLVSTKWVFTIKRHPDGSIDRYKARLVARGFSQVHGIDYTETFAPTVRMDTLRTLLAMVAHYDWECHTVDVNNAFTESPLDEKILISAPDGIPLPKGRCLWARKSLYGLKQAGRNWNKRCNSALKKLGFVQSLADPCLFTHGERRIILVVHVDDMAVAAPKLEDIKWFKSKLSGMFKIKDLGEIGKILGVRVTRNRMNRTLILDQAQYMEEVCKRSGVTTARKKPPPIPLNGFDKIQKATDDDERTDRHEYQQIIGGLLYGGLHTRPDIATAIGKLSQFLSDPTKAHAEALTELLHYVMGTLNWGIIFGEEDQKIKAYSDADWANDRIDRKSITGGVIMFNGGPLCWYSRKQKTVSTSSTEAEYIALASMAKQGQWLAQIVRDMGCGDRLGDSPEMVEMYGDNTGSLALVKNPHLHERSKHIDICHHYTRDLAEQGRLRITYVNTKDMVADGFTKPLKRPDFAKFVEQLGMVNCGAVGA